MFRTVSGKEVTRLGFGTWKLGEKTASRASETEAIRAAIDAGINLLDTAEMYGEGDAEILLGEAIEPYNRDDLYIVSKVYPWNAGRRDMVASCKNSLMRMKIDYIDCYLLHWRGNIPLDETIECLEELRRKELIREWGVSNFDTDDMLELAELDGGDRCITNQVLYNMVDRDIEFDLLPYQQKHGIITMAYCPLAQAGALHEKMYGESDIDEICAKHNISVEQLMLAYLLSQDGVYPIPKSSTPEHALANIAASHVELDAEDLKIIDRVFPPPDHKMPLKVV